MQIALFHSALGRRGVEQHLAETLRREGHEVVVPDLYEGRSVETLEDGLALKNLIGWDAIRVRAHEAMLSLPADTTLAGISMGAGVVSEVWQRRPHTPAVLMIHAYADIPREATGGGIRADMHIAANDSFAPTPLISQWRTKATAQGISANVYRYPGVGHFFTDPTSPDYDRVAADLLLTRVRRFAAEL